MTITEYCAMCGEPMTSCYCSPALKPMGTVTMTVTPGTLAPRREDAAGAVDDMLTRYLRQGYLDTPDDPLDDYGKRIVRRLQTLLHPALSTAEREREELADTLRYFVDRFSIQGTADSERYDRALALLARVPSGGEEGRSHE